MALNEFRPRARVPYWLFSEYDRSVIRGARKQSA